MYFTFIRPVLEGAFVVWVLSAEMIIAGLRFGIKKINKYWIGLGISIQIEKGQYKHPYQCCVRYLRM